MPWLRLEFQLCTACATRLALRQSITVRVTEQPEAVRCEHVLAKTTEDAR
ncbi:MAG TPA: hypothetical protein VH439_17275 [Gemmatimonadales bacterium]|jgi:hypothetical protein